MRPAAMIAVILAITCVVIRLRGSIRVVIDVNRNVEGNGHTILFSGTAHLGDTNAFDRLLRFIGLFVIFVLVIFVVRF